MCLQKKGVNSGHPIWATQLLFIHINIWTTILQCWPSEIEFQFGEMLGAPSNIAGAPSKLLKLPFCPLR